MAKPEVSWYNQANDTPVASWAIGTVDAGTVSPDTGFLIWNNRGAGSAVSDMTNCTLTTKDSGGGNTGNELVTNKWVEVRVDSMSESTFTAIGGATTKEIKALAQAAGTIKGTANNGADTATANFAQVTMHANVPAIATAGALNFLIRVAFQYT